MYGQQYVGVIGWRSVARRCWWNEGIPDRETEMAETHCTVRRVTEQRLRPASSGSPLLSCSTSSRCPRFDLPHCGRDSDGICALCCRFCRSTLRRKSMTRKPKTEWSGNTPVTPVTAKERSRINERIKKSCEQLRKRYKEVRGKRVDWISHSIEEG